MQLYHIRAGMFVVLRLITAISVILLNGGTETILKEGIGNVNAVSDGLHLRYIDGMQSSWNFSDILPQILTKICNFYDRSRVLENCS